MEQYLEWVHLMLNLLAAERDGMRYSDYRDMHESLLNEEFSTSKFCKRELWCIDSCPTNTNNPEKKYKYPFSRQCPV